MRSALRNVGEASGVPLVSIGVPVLNCERTLALSLRSIIWQTLQDWELLLLDGGSTDRSLEVARGFVDPRIRIIGGSEHEEPAARLNRAVTLSRGRYFARMDADDVSYPERLARQVAFLELHPEIDLVGAGIIVFRGKGEVVGVHRIISSHCELCRRPWSGFRLAHPTWMGRLRWFREYPYRDAAIRCEDQELLLRAYRHSKFACVPEVLLGYREENLSLKKILHGRYHFARMLLRGAREYGWDFAVRGAIEQTSKMALDLVSVSTGLNYRLLRHRKRPVSSEVMERWSAVWNEITRSGRQQGSQVAVTFRP